MNYVYCGINCDRNYDKTLFRKRRFVLNLMLLVVLLYKRNSLDIRLIRPHANFYIYFMKIQRLISDSHCTVSHYNTFSGTESSVMPYIMNTNQVFFTDVELIREIYILEAFILM